MFVRALDDLIANSKRILATRANNDWQKVVEGARGLVEGIGDNVRGAANSLIDNIDYTAARVADRGVGSYADSPLGYNEWRALDILERNGQKELANYAGYGLRQGRLSFDKDGNMPNVTNMGQIGAEEYAALQNAYRTAQQEAAAGQMVYDPRTLQMMQENEAVKQQARGLDFSTPPMAEPMQRMAEQQSPNQVFSESQDVSAVPGWRMAQRPGIEVPMTPMQEESLRYNIKRSQSELSRRKQDALNRML